MADRIVQFIEVEGKKKLAWRSLTSSSATHMVRCPILDSHPQSLVPLGNVVVVRWTLVSLASLPSSFSSPRIQIDQLSNCSP